MISLPTVLSLTIIFMIQHESQGAAFMPSSSFTGSATSVCSREELTTEYSCAQPMSSFHNGRSRANLSMPPFLKKLGLKKPEKPIFGGEEEGSSTNSAVIIKEDDTDASDTKLGIVVPQTKSATDEECVIEEEKELSETEKLLKQVKEAGTAGVISYALWELGFWALSVPVCLVGYYEVTGHWPDLSNQDDLSKLGAEAFAFVNFARFAVPLRIGLALGTTPWIQENIVDRFMKKDENECEQPSSE